MAGRHQLLRCLLFLGQPIIGLGSPRGGPVWHPVGLIGLCRHPIHQGGAHMGKTVAVGTYFVRLVMDGQSVTRKIQVVE